MVRYIFSMALALPVLILLLPVFVIVAGLLLFVAAVRSLSRLIEPRFVPWGDLMEFDPILGWKPRPNLDARYLAERDDVFRVVTDAQGWPGTRSLEESAVVAIGDSFAFGYGVDAGRSFADLTRGLSIKAVGAPGYSMVQSVLMMEQFAERLSGKLVVWFVCLENDLQDNLLPAMRLYRAPFVRPANTAAGWEIVGSHVSPEPWQSSNLGRRRILANLCAPSALSDRAYDATDYLIGRGARFCRSIGASLVLVTIPDPSQLTDEGRARLAAASGNAEQFDANLPDLRLSDICRRHGISMIAGKQHLSAADYKPIEALHWNPRGHRRVAAVLRDLFESFRAGKLAVVPPAAPEAAAAGIPVLYRSSSAAYR